VTIPIAAGSLLALVYLSAAYAALMRRLAVRLLGPGMAERLAAAEAEADRVAARNRLARELHDSIGHTLTTSTIQAAVAKQILDSDPDAARRAMESIVGSSRAALDDLDRALGVLRDEPAATRATPTLAELGTLRERIAQAGTELAVEIEGDLALVTPAVSQEAFRIVQEGATNALKHAPGSGMRLRIEIGDDLLRLRLTNPIPAGSSEAADGRGLTGIKERVRLLGGHASAGQREALEDRPEGREEVKFDSAIGGQDQTGSHGAQGFRTQSASHSAARARPEAEAGSGSGSEWTLDAELPLRTELPVE
jgi:signal transduction histidine kinase